uniref:N-acetyltransferase domain-containing protein n=1 Tax=Ditylenchus dipsaci TaxID=166011 RepID=A0A915CWN5_9BILA
MKVPNTIAVFISAIQLSLFILYPANYKTLIVTKDSEMLHKQNYESTKDEIASMAGDVNAFFIDENDEKCAEISLMIAEKNFRGQGLAQEACLLLMAYVKQSLKLPIFVAKINSDNVASIALFKRIGFEEVKFNKVFESFTFRFDATGFLLYFNLEKYQRMDENGN